MGDWRSKNVENRRESRAKVYYRAMLTAGGLASDVKLLDVSKLGALIECGLELTPDDLCVLIREDLQIPCRIVWVEGKRAGLEFDSEADPDEIAGKLAPRRN